MTEQWDENKLEQAVLRAYAPAAMNWPPDVDLVELDVEIGKSRLEYSNALLENVRGFLTAVRSGEFGSDLSNGQAECRDEVGEAGPREVGNLVALVKAVNLMERLAYLVDHIVRDDHEICVRVFGHAETPSSDGEGNATDGQGAV